MVAAKDLIIFGFAIFVIAYGYAYFICLIFGSDSIQLRTLGDIMLSMFYLNFTKGGNYELPSSLRHNEVLSRASLIIFLFLFTFIMSNVLVSIIIIRYKYLRSAVQLDNEANGRIFREVGREYNRKLLNLLF